MPKVSIILPVYNKEEYLSSTLELLIHQSFKDWELIIVNDGSTDRSKNIIDSYAMFDSRIKVLSQENKGVAVARNIGMSYAIGEWIWFVDADDLPDKEFLSYVFSRNYPDEIGIIVANFESIENNSTVCRTAIQEKGEISYKQFPDIFMKYQYKTGFWGYLWNKLIRRKKLVDNKLLFKEGLSLAEDLKFMVSLYRNNTDLYCVPCFAIRYTVDANNSSKTKKIDYFAQLEIQLEIKKWIVDYSDKKTYTDFFKNIISYYAAFVVFYGYEDNIDCKKLANELLDNTEVKKQLCTKNISSTMLPIVWCIKSQNFFFMKSYLFLRKKIRAVYRLLKKDK